MPKLNVTFGLQVELNDTTDPAAFTSDTLDLIRDAIAQAPGVLEVTVTSALVEPV